MRLILPLLLASAAAHSLAQDVQRPARAGDVHVYAVEQKPDRLRYEEVITVTGIEGERLRTRHARSDRPAAQEGWYGTDWSTFQSGNSGIKMEPAAPTVRHPLATGKAWEASVEAVSTTGARSRVKMSSTVAAREKVSTAAGEFDAFRIDTTGYISGLSWQGGWGYQQKVWYAPSIDRVVRSEYREQRTLGTETVFELKQFQPAN